jgi:hypothetical protein
MDEKSLLVYHNALTRIKPSQGGGLLVFCTESQTTCSSPVREADPPIMHVKRWLIL